MNYLTKIIKLLKIKSRMVVTEAGVMGNWECFPTGIKFQLYEMNDIKGSVYRSKTAYN
jgi:hypothetical protein